MLRGPAPPPPPATRAPRLAGEGGGGRRPPPLRAPPRGCAPAVSASSAVRPPLTQASSGKTIRLAKGESAILRLSNRWQWGEPRVSSRAVELTPVEYFVNPGFREWTIDGRKRGRATIRSFGAPDCTTCA